MLRSPRYAARPLLAKRSLVFKESSFAFIATSRTSNVYSRLASSPLSNISSAGMKTSNMVLSPSIALPRSCTDVTNALIKWANSTLEQLGESGRTEEAFKRPAPQRAPDAPPTVLSKIIAIFFAFERRLSPFELSQSSMILERPRDIFVPWSASPIAESRSFKRSLS